MKDVEIYGEFPETNMILPVVSKYASVRTTKDIHQNLDRMANQEIEPKSINFQELSNEGKVANIPQERIRTGKKIISHKIDSANTRHVKNLKMRKRREPNLVAINATVSLRVGTTNSILANFSL